MLSLFLSSLDCLGRKLKFIRNRQYRLINRFDDNFTFMSFVEQIDDGYFTLMSPSQGEVLASTTTNGTVNIVYERANGDERQQWDIIPTGDKDFYRIKTRSIQAGYMDHLFLQLSINQTGEMNLARRDNAYIGQQWRIL
jgi:hypothetical protein